MWNLRVRVPSRMMLGVKYMRLKTFPEKKEFQPVKLELIFESEDELLEFYHRFNLCWEDVISKFCSSYRVPEESTDISRKICAFVQSVFDKEI